MSSSGRPPKRSRKPETRAEDPLAPVLGIEDPSARAQQIPRDPLRTHVIYCLDRPGLSELRLTRMQLVEQEWKVRISLNTEVSHISADEL
jgi:hypothetical protein